MFEKIRKNTNSKEYNPPLHLIRTPSLPTGPGIPNGEPDQCFFFRKNVPAATNFSSPKCSKNIQTISGLRCHPTHAHLILIFIVKASHAKIVNHTKCQNKNWRKRLNIFCTVTFLQKKNGTVCSGEVSDSVLTNLISLQQFVVEGSVTA